MNARIHRVLDGEMPREALDPAEALELAAIEASVGSALQTVPREITPDLAPQILDRLDRMTARGSGEPGAAAAQPAPGWHGLLNWLWCPRPVQLTWRPAYGVVGLLAIAVGSAYLTPVGTGPSEVVPVPTQQVLVQFRLEAPDASQVALAGDFTGWEPRYVLRRSAPGVWTVVAPLDPGVHDYAFVVDGQHWVPDPLAPAVADGFGGLNSRVAVMVPESGRGL